MKVVLDTNIIISGLYSKRGASYQLLRAAISGELTFVISPLVAFEYEGKVYQKIEQGFLKVSIEDYGLILDALFAAAEIVWKPVQIRPILSESFLPLSQPPVVGNTAIPPILDGIERDCPTP